MRRLEDVTWWRRLRWLLLAAVPSSLMLGVTTYMSTDVAAVPFFWVVPLSLYLISFILVFLRWPIPWTGAPHTVMVLTQGILVVGFTFFLMQPGSQSRIAPAITISLLAFFFTAMMCHGELAKDRPGTKHLTEFYLWLSVGGMLGGIFNGLIAPVLFNSTLELYVAIVLACLLRPFRRNLARVDRPVLLLFGLVLGGLVGFVVQAGWLIGLLCVALGGVLGSMYQPQPTEQGWSEGWLAWLSPSMAEWAHAKGRDLRQGPQAAATPAEARPRVAAHGPPDYYVLSYALDFVLPLLLAILVYWIYSNQSVWGGWFLGLTKTLMLSAQSAVTFRLAMQNLMLFGLPVFILFLYSPRPIRMGLGVAAVFLFSSIGHDREETVLFAGRSYFGVLRVYETTLRNNSKLTPQEAMLTAGKDWKTWQGRYPPYTYLMHGTTHHGLNYQAPFGLRRLATTYYHSKGPVGVIMQRFNWFKDPVDTYHSDARLPVTMIGVGPDVWSQMGAIWSEPAYATIGLGTGTMASYSRPEHHMTYYEIDDTIRSFHLQDWPSNDNQPFFNYVRDAQKRGAHIEIIMGDARLSMTNEPDQGTGWDRHRDGYYHALVVDAFSSDAIPVHLITKEAIELYFQKLAPEGVLMVHTSNRHLDLVSPVTDIARSLKLAYRVGKDSGLRFNPDDPNQIIHGEDYRTGEYYFTPEFRGLFGSEYVMIARDAKYLPPETAEGGDRGLIWSTPNAPGNRVWTDDFSNLVGSLRFLH
jgi:hypothetical protein